MGELLCNLSTICTSSSVSLHTLLYSLHLLDPDSVYKVMVIMNLPQSKVGGPSPSSGPVCVDCLNPWTGEHLCENCGWPLCNDCGQVAAFAKNVLWKLKMASALRLSPSSWQNFIKIPPKIVVLPHRALIKWNAGCYRGVLKTWDLSLSLRRRQTM